ncbi:hypothetical protein LSTR_LSTR015771 [Laodelphax striatellus]|uniref:Uncharacterized protein n=1 Tax=Laodelphax striatellus TaxID=195883 RepID=A0A482WVK2_LAOST|nr:hypothetical protein LSTR_LSTR015771 [Laodelphax striatellus]
MQVEGCRPVGRPRRRWRDCVAGDMREKELTDEEAGERRLQGLFNASQGTDAAENRLFGKKSPSHVIAYGVAGVQKCAPGHQKAFKVDLKKTSHASKSRLAKIERAQLQIYFAAANESNEALAYTTEAVSNESSQHGLTAEG